MRSIENGPALAIALLLLGLALACPRASAQSDQSSPQSPASRGLKIVVASDAPPSIEQAAQSILAAISSDPLLTTLAGAHPPTGLTMSSDLLAAPAEQRAFDHLILVGLPTDPMIAAAWQREAAPEGANGLYIFGYGHLAGDIGYIESDRNPFLHGQAIKYAPYETEVITVTGSDAAGVALAANALLHEGLIAGVVAGSGWTRPRPNLLERDPLPANFEAPPWIPAEAGTAIKIGLTQASEEEYRGVLADTQVEPDAIWRVKYYLPGSWDGPGSASSLVNYSNGLHRRAYGNTLWCAEFADPTTAQFAAPKIATAAGLRQTAGGKWTGDQPPYSYPGQPSAGPLTLWTTGRWVFMSTLPGEVTGPLEMVTPT